MKQATNLQTQGKLTQSTHPKALLSKLVMSSSSGILEIASYDAVWRIYIEGGKLVFASCSITPLDALDRHLRDFSRIVPALNRDVRGKIRSMSSAYDSGQDLPFSYEAIRVLENQNHIDSSQVISLIKRLSQEALESYLLLVAGEYRFIEISTSLQASAHLDLLLSVQECQYRIQAWRNLGPDIWSPYQRPYYFSQGELQRQSVPERFEKYVGALRGFSLRQLAVMLGQDELSLAQTLAPEIAKKNILLREPKPPYDMFPRFSDQFSSIEVASETNISYNAQEFADQFLIENKTGSTSRYTVICIDDSPAVLKMVQRYLIPRQAVPYFD